MITTETKHLLDEIPAQELAKERRQERPERNKSVILKMIPKMGSRAWTQEYGPKAT